MPRFAPVIKIVLFSMFITFSFRIIVLSIGYYASLGGEDTSQAKDFGIGGVTSWLDGGVDSLCSSRASGVLQSSDGREAWAIWWMCLSFSSDRPSKSCSRRRPFLIRPAKTLRRTE